MVGTERQAMTMFCSHCGNPLPIGSDSCPGCDASGKAASDPGAVPYSTIPEQAQTIPVTEPGAVSYTGAPEQVQTIPVAGPGAASYTGAPEIDILEDASPVTPRIAELEVTSVIMEPVPDPAAMPVPKAIAEKPKRPGARRLPPALALAAKIALSIILALLLLVFILTSTVLIAVHPESASKVVENADVTWILEETDLGDIIVNELNASEFISISLDIDNINSFLKRENVSAEVGKVAGKYAKAISDGNYDYYLSSKEIISFIKAVSPDISEEFHTNLTDADYDLIADSINKQVDLREFSVGKIFDDADMNAAVPYMLLSVYPLIVIVLLGILSVLNTYLLHRKRIRTAFLCVGIPFALSGLICFVAGLLLGPYSGVFAGSGLHGIAQMIIGVVDMLFLPALVYAAIGLISLVTFAVASRMRTQYMLIDYNKTSVHIWKATGLIANASVLLICLAFSLLFYFNIPK